MIAFQVWELPTIVSEILIRDFNRLWNFTASKRLLLPLETLHVGMNERKVVDCSGGWFNG
jgi:hypothetical protein